MADVTRRDALKSAGGAAAALAIPASATAADKEAGGKPGRPVAIRDVAVFDSIHGKMLPRQTVVIEGETIRAVGPESPVPPDAQVIDGAGQYLIPGLIDAHVHLVHLSDRTHVTGDETLPMYLGNGVTSVRSTGDALVAQKLIARYAERHPELCPRVHMASPLIDGDPPFHKDVGLAVTDPKDVPALVDDLKEWGVVTVKLYVGCSRAVGRKVIEEGHRRGLVVTGHLSAAYPAQEAVADGIDCLEHIWGVIDFILAPGETRATVNLDSPRLQALIAALKRGNVAVDPTLAVFRNMILLSDQPEYNRHADVARVPERMRAEWTRWLQRLPGAGGAPLEVRKKEFRKYRELTGILHRAGVTLLAGTDAPEPFVPPGYSLHQELEMLVEAGLGPAAALSAATIQNARVLRQGDRLGSVQEGKLADLVLLRRDPLADIRNTRSISTVIRGGRVLDPQAVLKTVPVN
ncbi:MAG: amidohydrolase family protein [Gemmataceae bacterium]|nr:amidohydrolase family protein [Gemmataceae bacterium]